MINIRQVSNVIKDGGDYTLVDVKAIAEDQENGKQAIARKAVNTTYPNVSSLFQAIQQHTVDLVTSGLI